MKNQYVGDIGDYGKYGLLRFLAVKGIRIGVNWYLTENDESDDGKFTDYLSHESDRQYDESLFDKLQSIVAKGRGRKRVQDIEENDIIPNTLFYHEILKTTDLKERDVWHKNAMSVLLSEDVQLIFADPDNGTLKEKAKASRKNGEKYALLEELREYYDNGKDVVYYCHKARRTEEAWRDKKDEFNEDGHHAEIIVLTFHRGTQRSYIFAIHPENYRRYDAMLDAFLAGAWGSVSADGKQPPFTKETCGSTSKTKGIVTMDQKRLQRKKPFCGMLPHLPDETMTPGRMRIDTDGKKEAAKHVYERQGTAQDFRRAYIVGGGDMGAAIHGTPDNYTYHICKNDLWWDDFDSDPPCYFPGGIRELRERVAAGDPTVKQEICAAANRRNNQPNQTSAARLTLHLISGGVQSQIAEKMELHTGVITQTYGCGNQNGVVCGQGFTTVSCLSPAEDVLFIACTASPRAGHLGKLSLELTKDPMEVSANVGFLSPDEIARLEEEIDKYYTPVPFTDGRDFGFTMRLRAGRDPENSPDTHYTVMMRSNDPNLTACAAGSKVIAEGRPKGPGVKFLLTVVSTYDAADTVAEAKRRLDKVEAGTMDSALWNCTAWYDHLWKRSWIRLPDTAWSRPWYWAVYQAMASRMPGKQPAGYLAPWYQSSYANWGHHLLTYEQAKTNLGLLPTNHAELLEPWFWLLHNSREQLLRFTRDFYGMNGTAYPHAISNTGTVTASSVPLNGTMMNLQTAGESVKYCWDYYDCTGDPDFLREVGYPPLRDAAIFYHEYLLTDGETGQKYIFPSRSQEYVNTVGLSNEFMTDSLIDLCLFRNTLDKAAKAADLLGVDADLAAAWRADLAALRPDYALWPDGTWKTAADTDDRTLDYGPAPVTDLAPICYTGEVDAWHGATPELMEAAKKTAANLVPDDEIPWDRSFGMIARLRMGDAAYAGRMLKLIPEECEVGGNLEEPIPFDCDYSVGKGTAATAQVISEMLLQSQGGVLRFFPAWDFSLGDAAFYSLRCCGAFLASAETREGKIAYAIIRSLAGNPCTVQEPFANARVRDLEIDEPVAFTRENGSLRFATLKNHEYAIEREDAPLESFPVLK